MKNNIVRKLNKLNEDFYEKVADSFDSKRPNIWTGWDDLISFIKSKKTDPRFVLDIACGNGRFAPLITNHFPNTKYIGLDSCKSLIEKARERYQNKNTEFIYIDILEYLRLPNETKFDLITMLSFIHHIPEKQSRIDLLKNVSKLLSNNGLLIITFWQFMKNENLKEKTKDWSNVNINPKDLEKNDYILGWDNMKNVYRYCHYTDDDEIDELVEKSGLKIVSSYEYTGSSGKLSRTIVCKKK